MSDLERDGYGAVEEDRLPWLEPVDEEPIEEGVSPGRLIAGLIVALIALGLVVGGVYWLKQRSEGPAVVASADTSTIAAPATPYKVKPAEPGGMQVKGQGDSSYAASEGADVNGQIDLAATPETPVTKAAPVPAAKPTPTPAPVQVAKAPVVAPVPAKVPAAEPKPVEVAKAPAATPAATPAAGGSQVQLGAFSSQAKAEAAWKSLSGRFASLAPLSHTAAASEVGGKTVYRLRAAAGAQAGTVCAKLKVAGETCLVVG